VPRITTNYIKTKAVNRIPICLIKSCAFQSTGREYCPVRSCDTRKKTDERILWYNKRRYFPLMQKRTVFRAIMLKY
jgi:hypothetical protein